MDIYRELILDHYKNPRNFGFLDRFDAASEAYNATCGDKLRIEIRVKSQKSKVKSIQDIRFSGEGCAISQASASMLTESIKGKSVDRIMKLTREDVLVLLGTELTPSRVKCATLPLEVLQKAVLSI